MFLLDLGKRRGEFVPYGSVLFAEHEEGSSKAGDCEALHAVKECCLYDAGVRRAILEISQAGSQEHIVNRIAHHHIAS